MSNADSIIWPAWRGAVLGVALVLASGPGWSASPSQAPLFLVEGVSPNLIVTLDDSGSMTSAYTPDGMSSYTIANRSSSYNPMYYNPAITYEAPWKVTFSGGRLISERYTTSFDKVFYDGFLTIQTGTLDLNKYTGNGYGQNSIQTVNTTDSYKQYAHYYQFDAACPHARNTATSTLSAVQNCAADSSYSNANACTKSCFAPRWVTTAEEKQNYANWFSFYRTRQLATRTAANLALFDLPDHIRVTWQALNSCYSTNFNQSSTAWQPSPTSTRRTSSTSPAAWPPVAARRWAPRRTGSTATWATPPPTTPMPVRRAARATSRPNTPAVPPITC